MIDLAERSGSVQGGGRVRQYAWENLFRTGTV